MRALVTVFLLVSIVGTLYWWTHHSDYFAIREVTVITQSEETQPSDRILFANHHQIREEKNKLLNQNIFSLDLKKVKKDFESIPFVKEVEVIRVGLDGIKINLTERIPLANFSHDNHWIIDREGTLIQSPYTFNGLISVSLFDPLYADVYSHQIADFIKQAAIIVTKNGFKIDAVYYSSLDWKLSISNDSSKMEVLLNQDRGIRALQEQDFAKWSAEVAKCKLPLGRITLINWFTRRERASFTCL